jgi:hypothetical protein
MAPESKHVVAKPSARLVLIETQPALMPEGVMVERYATVRGGTIYEKHTGPNDVVHWFRVERGTPQNG